jgi:hydroxyethylthiazole kinase-like uncharacterized protein yjeF
MIEIKAQVRAIAKRELPEIGLFIRLLPDGIFAEIVIFRLLEIDCQRGNVKVEIMEQWKKWTEDEARLFIALPSNVDDKYSRGVIGVIAGSSQYPGAAVMVCEGAMRTGVGMVRYLGPSKAQSLILTHRPEVVTQDGQVQAWTIGSGIDAEKIGRRRERTMRAKLEQGIPVILDAGGLSLIPLLRGPGIITPHYRELASLLRSTGTSVSEADVGSEPKKWARFAADALGVTVLLKGNVTYVVSGERSIELPSASPWLATAGTGDVLAGIIGALVATHSRDIAEQPDFLSSLAATGSLIHAKAAQIASNGGPISAMAVAHAIPTVISDLLHKGI